MINKQKKSIKIEFKITQEEFINSFSLHYLTKQKMILLISLGLSLMYILYVTKIFTKNITLENILFISIFLIIYLQLTLFSYKYSAKKQYNTSKILQSSYILTVQDSGLSYNYELGENIINWNAIIKTLSNNSFYLLYTSNNNFLIIPKRIMSKEQIKIFDSYIRN